MLGRNFLAGPVNSDIFYRPVKNGIEVVRILHGARDLPPLFAQENAGNYWLTGKPWRAY